VIHVQGSTALWSLDFLMKAVFCNVCSVLISFDANVLIWSEALRRCVTVINQPSSVTLQSTHNNPSTRYCSGGCRIKRPARTPMGPMCYLQTPLCTSQPIVGRLVAAKKERIASSLTIS